MNEETKISCVFCSEPYSFSESTATVDNKRLYCSKDCEDTDAQYISEQAKYINEILDNNPLALQNTLNQEKSTVANSYNEKQSPEEVAANLLRKFGL